MRKFAAIVTVAFVAFAFVLPLERGAAQSRFQMPDGGPVPDELKPNPVTKQPWKVWVAYQGYQPRYAYQEDGTRVSGVELEFMQPLFVAKSHQDAEKQYLFLAKSDSEGKRVNEPIGWVNEEVVVLRQSALVDPATSIHKKVRIVNTIEAARQARTEEDLVKAGIRWAPTPTAPTRTYYQLSNLFFVYAEAGDYLLIGSGPYFSDADGRKPEDVVQGWLHVSRASQWFSREAFEWNRESTLPDSNPRRLERGAILEYETAARNWLGDDNSLESPRNPQENGPDSDEAAFWEVLDANRVSIAFSHDEPRFPILETIDRDLETQNWLYKVGWVGKFVPLGGPQEVPGGFGDLDRRLKEAQQAAKNLDILIVIDDTTSMRRYFQVVADALEQILGSIQKYEDRNIRVAVSYYADADASDVPFKTARLVPVANRSQMSSIINEARKHKPQGGGDAPESVFEGIIRAVDAAGFSPYAQKLVIVIGETGDKSQEGVEVAKEKKKVIDELVPPTHLGLPCEFYAVHTEARDIQPWVQREPDAVLFEIQMKAIAQQLNDRVNQRNPEGERETLAAYVHSSGTNAVKESLIKRYENIQRAITRISSAISALRRGEWHTAIGPAVRRRLELHGVDVDKLQVMKGSQIYQEGYVWQYTRGRERIPQVRTKVLLERSSVEDIVRILEKLVGERPFGLVKESLPGLVEEEVRRIAGDANAIESLNAVFFKKNGLPCKSPLLRLTNRQLRTFAIMPEHVDYLKLRLRRLQDLLKDQRSDWQFQLTKRESGELGRKLVCSSRRTVKRAFTIPGDPLDTEWYWVDLEDELP